MDGSKIPIVLSQSPTNIGKVGASLGCGRNPGQESEDLGSQETLTDGEFPVWPLPVPAPLTCSFLPLFQVTLAPNCACQRPWQNHKQGLLILGNNSSYL